MHDVSKQRDKEAGKPCTEVSRINEVTAPETTASPEDDDGNAMKGIRIAVGLCLPFWLLVAMVVMKCCYSH